MALLGQILIFLLVGASRGGGQTDNYESTLNSIRNYRVLTTSIAVFNLPKGAEGIVSVSPQLAPLHIDQRQ